MSLQIAIASFTASGTAFAERPVTDGMRGWPVGYGTRSVNASRDPWVAVDDATVARSLTPAQRLVHRVRRIAVDYDDDGVPDVAWMVANRTQMGVLVRLGASGRTVLAFRAEGEWSDQQLYRIGRRTIGIEFPESTIVMLSSESGKPTVRYMEEGGREGR